MDLLEVVRCEMLDGRGVFDGELHRVDIGQDLGRLGAHRCSHVVPGLGPRECPHVHLHPFDPGRRDRLCPQEQAHQRQKRRTRLGVQRRDRTLRIGDHPGQIPGQLDTQSGD